jgi:hypothetical protein
MALPRVGFRLNQAAVGQLFRVGGQVYVRTGRFADRVLARAVHHAPRGATGHLRRSFRKVAVASARGVAFHVTNEADYAWAVHEGTPPHTIRPRAGRVLAFKVEGEKVFAREVHHPGAKGVPFLRRALAEELPRGI